MSLLNSAEFLETGANNPESPMRPVAVRKISNGSKFDAFPVTHDKGLTDVRQTIRIGGRLCSSLVESATEADAVKSVLKSLRKEFPGFAKSHDVELGEAEIIPRDGKQLIIAGIIKGGDVLRWEANQIASKVPTIEIVEVPEFVICELAPTAQADKVLAHVNDGLDRVASISLLPAEFVPFK